MPRNSAGAYTLPLPPVVAGNTIMASFENTTDSDIASELTNSLDRNGRGGMLAPFKIADGTVSAPGIAFTQDPDNGFYRIGTDNWAAAVGGAKVLDLTAATTTVQNGFTVAGPMSINGGVGITGAVGTIAAGPNGTSLLVVVSATGSDAAYMAFHRSGTYASLFGIDSDNEWKIGGWSMGAASYKLLHEGNSFTVAPSMLNSGGRGVTVGDLSVIRPIAGGTSGLIYLGNTGGAYLLFDNVNYHLVSHTLIVDSLGIGMSAGYPLVVRTGVNQNLALYSIGGIGTLACVVDDLSNWTTLGLYGPSVVPSIDNACTFGFSANRWTSLWSTNGAIQTSDARQKKDVKPTTLGLAFIESLTPIEYTWINEKNEVTREQDGVTEIPERVDIDGNVIPATTEPKYKDVVTPTPGTRPHWGLIAQEVQAAVLAAGVGKDAIVVQDTPDGMLGMNYSEFISPLVKAVQELSARVVALEAAP